MIYCITIILKGSAALEAIITTLLLPEVGSVSFLDTFLCMHAYHKSNNSEEQ